MDKEICCNWSDLRRGCEALKTKSDGYSPKDGSTCRFYKTKEQKKIDDKNTKKRLKQIGNRMKGE